jgi:signal transduction histidine kinase
MTNAPGHNLTAPLDHIPFPLMLLDMAGDIHYVNPAACRLLDQTAPDLIGIAFADQPYGRNLEKLVQSDLWQATDTKRSYTVWATALYTAMAERTSTLVQLTTAGIGWSPLVLLNVFLSESLTPLTASRGYAELLVCGASGPLSEPQREMIQALRSQIDRVLVLGDDVLELAKIHVHNQESLGEAAG